MPGAVRAWSGTGARHSARPVNLEQTMTKAPSKTRKTTQKTERAIKPSLPAPLAAPATAPVIAFTSDLKPPRQTKAARLRARLSDPGGASLTALMEMTGWQAHTLRAALTGLRNAGLSISRRREGEDTIYAIEADAPPPTADDGADDKSTNSASDVDPTALTPELGA
jgi:Protein of unknown function (DUF3489)